MERLQVTVAIDKKLLADLLEELYAWRGSHAWWADEPRGRYAARYINTCKLITQVENLLSGIGDAEHLV